MADRSPHPAGNEKALREERLKIITSDPDRSLDEQANPRQDPDMRFALLVGWIGCAAVLAGADDIAKPKAISGTFTAAFEGFSQFDQPQVRLRLQLASSLTCPPSAPKLTFSVKGGVDAYFVSELKEKAGYISAGFASAVEKDGHP